MKNKRQHYVPKFLLRKFSSSSDEAIRLILLKNGKIIPDASIRNQCYGDYFYGKDGAIEGWLTGIEGESATVFLQLPGLAKPPKQNGPERMALNIFIATCIGRTQSASDDGDVMFDGMMQAIARPFFEAKGIPQEIIAASKFVMTNSTTFSLSTVVSGTPFFMDLDLRLLESKSKSFVIGDNPALLVNQLFHKKMPGLSSTGIAMAGLQILCPITPSHTLFFFDPVCYKSGTASQKFIIPLTEDETQTLNSLQFLNSKNCVFLPKEVRNGYASSIYNRTKNKVGINRVEVKSYRPQNKNEKSEFVHAHKEDLPIKLNWSFCSPKTKRRNLRPQPRDQELCDRHDKVFKKRPPIESEIADLFIFGMRRAAYRYPKESFLMNDVVLPAQP